MTFPHPEKPPEPVKLAPASTLTWRRVGKYCMVSTPPGYAIAKVGGLYEVSRGPHVILACPGLPTLDEAQALAQGDYQKGTSESSKPLSTGGGVAGVAKIGVSSSL